jgi:hypothetical protein
MHMNPTRLALAAFAVGAMVFAHDSSMALSATTLKTVTTQDKTASVGLPSGWKLTKGSNGFIAVTGPNAEQISLGVLVIGKNASGGSLGGEVAFALPYSASLQDKFATILQAGEAKSGKPPLQFSGASEHKMPSNFRESPPAVYPPTNREQSGSFVGIADTPEN